MKPLVVTDRDSNSYILAVEPLRPPILQTFLLICSCSASLWLCISICVTKAHGHLLIKWFPPLQLVKAHFVVLIFCSARIRLYSHFSQKGSFGPSFVFSWGEWVAHILRLSLNAHPRKTDKLIYVSFIWLGYGCLFLISYTWLWLCRLSEGIWVVLTPTTGALFPADVPEASL